MSDTREFKINTHTTKPCCRIQWKMLFEQKQYVFPWTSWVCVGAIICTSNTATAGHSALSLDRFMDYAQSAPMCKDNGINVHGCNKSLTLLKTAERRLLGWETFVVELSWNIKGFSVCYKLQHCTATVNTGSFLAKLPCQIFLYSTPDLTNQMVYSDPSSSMIS